MGPGRAGEPPRPVASLQEAEPRAGRGLPCLPVLVSSVTGHSALKTPLNGNVIFQKHSRELNSLSLSPFGSLCISISLSLSLPLPLSFCPSPSYLLVSRSLRASLPFTWSLHPKKRAWPWSRCKNSRLCPDTAPPVLHCGAPSISQQGPQPLPTQALTYPNHLPHRSVPVWFCVTLFRHQRASESSSERSHLIDALTNDSV